MTKHKPKSNNPLLSRGLLLSTHLIATWILFPS